MSIHRLFRGVDLALLLGLSVPAVTGCAVQWVSPYNADLQKKSSDMLVDVVAWEAHMRAVAGTAAADPRNPDVEAKLSTWQGNIEAMAAIEISIDPGSTMCDTFLQKINGAIGNQLKTLPTAPALASAGGGLGLSAPKPVTHCETLPDIFKFMDKQVTTNIPAVLTENCQLPWLSDDYFTALKEKRPAPAVPTPTDEQLGQRKKCQSLFEVPSGGLHGNAVSSLVNDLDSIIYREGREAPQGSK